MSGPAMNPSEEYAALWLNDLKRSASAATDWLWQGYLARGNLTLLTSQWKAGKTTLLALLLDRMKAGGELIAQRVAPGKALVISEEPAGLWLERSQRFDFADHVCWICRPFKLKRDGSGVKGDAFRYRLPSLEEKWKTDPVALALQKVADSQHSLMNDADPWPLPGLEENE